MTRTSGVIEYKNKKYQYTVYFTPLSPDEADDVIHFFGNRFHKGERCFNIEESYIVDTLTEKENYAYIRVNEVGHDDHATAIIYFADWCKKSKKQVFVMTLCRSGVK